MFLGKSLDIVNSDIDLVRGDCEATGGNKQLELKFLDFEIWGERADGEEILISGRGISLEVYIFDYTH